MSTHPHDDGPTWAELAPAWGLPIEAMPDAMRHVQARLLEEWGSLVLTGYDICHDGTERRYYLPEILQPDSRILVTTRPANWDPDRENQALRALHKLLDQPLDFTS